MPIHIRRSRYLFEGAEARAWVNSKGPSASNFAFIILRPELFLSEITFNFLASGLAVSNDLNIPSASSTRFFPPMRQRFINRKVEYPAVVIAFASQHYAMLARNLVSIAVTGGKRLVVIVGRRTADRDRSEERGRAAALDETGGVDEGAAKELTGCFAENAPTEGRSDSTAALTRIAHPERGPRP